MASHFADLSKDHTIKSPLTIKIIMETYSNPNPSGFGSDKQRNVFICIKCKTTSGKFVRTRWTTCYIYAFGNHKFAFYKELKFQSCKHSRQNKMWLEATMHRGQLHSILKCEFGTITCITNNGMQHLYVKETRHQLQIS